MSKIKCHVYEVRGLDAGNLKHTMRFEIFRNRNGLNFLPYCNYGNYKAWSVNLCTNVNKLDILAERIHQDYIERNYLVESDLEYLGSYNLED